MKRKITQGLVALLAGICLFASGCASSPAKQVATIDFQAIVGLEEFKKADEELKAYTEEALADLKKRVEGKAQEEVVALTQEVKSQVEQKRNELSRPLKTRAESAVAKVARDKNVLVVLSKPIVLYGVEDITEEVKTLFQSGQEIVLPEEQDVTVAPVGYFDPQVVQNLTHFKEVQLKIRQRQQQIYSAVQEKLKDKQPSQAEMKALQQQIELEIAQYREGLLTPLLADVNEAVDEVAKEGDLSLVLDKQYVMYGGANLTDQVVERFLDKVENKDAASPEQSGSDNQAASPQATSEPSGNEEGVEESTN